MTHLASIPHQSALPVGAVPHHHGRVAFLPFARLTLKCLKPNDLGEPTTLGEHIKQHRLKLALTQKEAGQHLRVTAITVLHWEKGNNPRVEHWPAILAFLGYDPRPGAAPVKDQLFTVRQTFGWSQETAAAYVGVDPSTWSSWEAGGTIMLKKHRRTVAWLLGLPESDVAKAMAKRWGRAHRKRG